MVVGMGLLVDVEGRRGRQCRSQGRSGGAGKETGEAQHQKV